MGQISRLNGLEFQFSEGRDRVAIIMPVYNEADTIENTLRELYGKIVKRMDNVGIWVFEDGSTDGTKEVIEKLAIEFPGLRAKMTKQKKGYPRAMKEAFLSIDSSEYDYVITIDSDGQYEPNDFFKLWRIMQRDSPDIVMGRRTSRKEPLYRRFLSQGLRILEGLMFQLQCKDVTSAMRLMRVEVAHHIAKEICYSKYNFWLEFTARMALKNYRVVETPIMYRERLGVSKVYSVNRMPQVIMSEFNALRAVKREHNGKHLL
jgi:glycosyltransferase involved in cell wall biosynthesis